MGPCHSRSAPRESPGSTHVHYFYELDIVNREVNTTLYADKSKICAVKGVHDFEAVQTTKTCSFQY